MLFTFLIICFKSSYIYDRISKTFHKNFYFVFIFSVFTKFTTRELCEITTKSDKNCL